MKKSGGNCSANSTTSRRAGDVAPWRSLRLNVGDRRLGEVPNVRDSLGATLQSNAQDAGETSALAGKKTTRRTLWLGRAKVVSAMAASFLAAMWLGTVAQHAWVGHSRIAGGGGTTEVADLNGFHPSVTPDDTGSRLATAPLRAGSASSPWRVVTVSAPADGQQPRSAIEVPAVERENIDEQWRRSVPPAIPDNVLQALARTGHQIEQQREFVPVPLKDGRQLVVPVDRVKVALRREMDRTK